ncbi:EF-hand calcium-binding domain-containing protein 14 [Oryzias melastigma]|uniref:EF-hand calcium-binding domain-containing protein 14 n=1 Tax=Oryzias melastigma TaxID=30732 RepID=A0A834F9L8_ORYME|nr:EF-hand calcium-binding domain-containing protein 14 [Oryzias melastigma]
MKKRKELNALIGLGDSKRKKTKKGSGHRLLRTEPPGSESDSSSEDDFNNLNNGANFGKRNYTQCCNVCYPLFLFIILAACVMACAGLIWMQIALKEDLDSMKEKLHSMESTQKLSSSEILKLNEDLKNKEKKLESLENGDSGLNKVWSNLTEMNRKISLLDSAVSHLKANLKSAADLISLPTTVEELQKSVATIGSTLTSVQHDVKTMQTALESQKNEDNVKKTVDITDLRKVMTEVNKTEEKHHTWTDEQIHILLSTVAELHQRVAFLENGSKHGEQNNGTEASSEFRKPPETLTTEASPEITSPQPKTSRRPRFLTSNRHKRNVGIKCSRRVFLEGVSSLKELEDIFERAVAERHSPGLTYSDLKEVFKTSAPSQRTMECFDSNGDRMYSLTELRVAVGF